MAESYTHKDKRCVFRETFDSAESVARNGNVAANVTFDGRRGNFNGSNSGITTHLKPLGSTHSIRIIFCLYSTTTSNDTTLIGGKNTFCSLTWNVAWGNVYDYYNDNGTLLRLTPTVPLSLNREYEIVVTRSNTAVLWYVDGVLSKSGTLGDNGPFTMRYVGRDKSLNANYWLNGYVSLVEIYNKALSAAEIRNLYYGIPFHRPVMPTPIFDLTAERGFVEERTGKNLTITNVPVVRFGKTYAMKFDGITGKIDTGSQWIDTKAATFHMLIQSNRGIDNAQSQVGYLVTNNDFFIEHAYDKPSIGYLFYGGRGMTSYTFLNRTYAFYKKWVYVTGIIPDDSKRFSLVYLNGGLNINQSVVAYTGVGSLNVWVGGTGTSNLYKGFVHHMTVWSGILTSEQITQLYTYEKTLYGLQ